MSQALTDLQKAFSRLIGRYIGGAVLLLLVFLGVSVLWNRSIKQGLADQATLFIRRSLQIGDTRGEFQMLNGIRLDAFHSITQYDRQGKRIITLPPTVAPIEYKGRGFWERIFLGEIRSVIRMDDERETPLGEVSFIYSRFELAIYAILLWLIPIAFLGIPISNDKKKLTKEMEKEIALQNSKVLKDLVGKVRHNTQGPLAVLDACFTDTSAEPLVLKDQGHRAVRRIREIFSEMEDGPEAKESTDQKLLAVFDAVALAGQIVDEKSMLQTTTKITVKSQVACAFTRIDGADLKANFSNLLDNALQAVGKDGEIWLEIEADGHMIAVSIQDNGKGIAPELLPKVREKGFTHGKEKGSGLGLYYAEKLMEGAGGGLTIESEPGKGTTVSLMFPQEPTPPWFCGGLVIPKGGTLYICDDQSYMLQAWQMKLPNYISTQLFKTLEALPAASKVGPNDRFLIDHDFGPNQRTGLAANRELPNPAHAVLVTGRAYEAEIQAGCAEVGCKLLSKDLIVSFSVTTA